MKKLTLERTIEDGLSPVFDLLKTVDALPTDLLLEFVQSATPGLPFDSILDLLPPETKSDSYFFTSEHLSYVGQALLKLASAQEIPLNLDAIQCFVASSLEYAKGVSPKIHPSSEDVSHSVKSSDSPPPRDFYTSAEAAQFLRMEVKFFRKLCKEGRGPVGSPGGKGYIYAYKDLIAFHEANKGQTLSDRRKPPTTSLPLSNKKP